jgi:hypothetical protein
MILPPSAAAGCKRQPTQKYGSNLIKATGAVKANVKVEKYYYRKSNNYKKNTPRAHKTPTNSTSFLAKQIVSPQSPIPTNLRACIKEWKRVIQKTSGSRQRYPQTPQHSFPKYRQTPIKSCNPQHQIILKLDIN